MGREEAGVVGWGRGVKKGNWYEPPKLSTNNSQKNETSKSMTHTKKTQEYIKVSFIDFKEEKVKYHDL